MSTALDSRTAPGGAGNEDLSAVSWVAGELQRSLDTAHKALRRFLKEAQAAAVSDVDAPDAAILRQTRVQLHQSVGALELVGLPEPARVLRASEAAVQRISAKPSLLDAAAVETIESASFAVIDYLNRLLARRPTSPVALFPQYRAVQTLAGVDRIHPADLWGARWRWQPLAREAGVTPRAADDGARGDMESLVLALMRRADAAAMARLSDFCAQIGAGAASVLATTTWQLAAAFFDAQANGLLDSDVYAKRMASRLLAQLRANVRAADEVSELLASDLLFFCARARAPGPGQAQRLQAVRLAWELGDTAANTDYETPRLGRFDPALIAQARKRVVTAKDVWSAVAGGDERRLPTLAEPFALLGDSLRRLFPGGEVLAKALQAAAGQTMVSGTAPPTGLAMEVATAVLWIDAALEEAALDTPELAERVRHIAARIDQARDGGDVQPLEPWIEELYRRVSDQQTMGSVVHELRASLTEVEKSIDQYFRNPKQRDVLVPVPAQLQAMRGVLSVLDLQQASAAVLHMNRQIDELAQTEVDPALALQAGTFDRLADNLGTLGFLIDMLSVQPNLARTLFHFDAEQGCLIADTGGAAQPSGFGGLGPPSPVALQPPVPLLDKVLTLAEAAVHPQVSDEDLAHRLAALGEHAVVEDQAALARVAAQAQAALHGAEDEVQKQAARADLAAAVQQWAEPVAVPVEAAAAAPMAARPGLDKPSAPGTTGLEEDDEMRGIFLEEAREVIGNAREALQALAANSEDVAEMTIVRRAFHTLKGSSRMVGLREFGEAAWGCEQLYNARLASDPRVDLGLADFTRSAFEELAEWVEDIEQRHDGHRSARPLSARADALRLGRQAEPPTAPPPAPPEQPTISLTSIPATASPVIVRDISRTPARIEDQTPKLPALPGVPEQAEPITAGVVATAEEPEETFEGHTVFETLVFETSQPGLPSAATGAMEADAATIEPVPGTAPPADAGLTLPELAVEATQILPPSDQTLVLLVPDLPSAADLDLALLPVHDLSHPVVTETPQPAPAGPPEAPAAPAPAGPDWHSAPTVEMTEMQIKAAMQGPSAQGASAPQSPADQAPAHDWHSAPTVEMSVLALTAEQKSPRIPGSQLPEVVEVIDATAGVAHLPLPEVTDELGELFGEAGLQEVPLTLDLAAAAPDLLPEIDLTALDDTAVVEGPLTEQTLILEREPALPHEQTQVRAEWPQIPDVVLPLEATQVLRPLFDAPTTAAEADLPELTLDLGALHEEIPPTEFVTVVLEDEPPLPEVEGTLILEPAGEAEPAAELPDSAPTPVQPLAESSANDAVAPGAGDDEGMRVIGPLRISIPLFNIFLNEADEQSRRLVTELAEWALEWRHAAVPEGAEALAHSLAGNSATVGHAELSALARALEHAITRSRRQPRGCAGESELFSDAAEEIRRLLHQFAAGFLKTAPAVLLARLADHEHWPLVESPELAEPLLADDAPQPELRQAIPATLLPAAEPVAEDDIDAADEIDAELLPIFIEEAEELLPQLQERVSEWIAHHGNRAAADGAMRNLHTFKGGARLAGAMRVGEMAHRLETEVERLLGAETTGAHDLDALQGQVDRIAHAFEALRRPQQAAPAIAPAAATALPAIETPAAPAPDAEAEPVDEHAAALAAITAAAAAAAEITVVAAVVETAPEPTVELAAEADEDSTEAIDLPLDEIAAPEPLAPIDWGRFLAAMAGGAARADAAAAQIAPSAASGVVRVRSGLLDRLVNSSGEVSIARARIEADVRLLQGSLGELTGSLERMRRELREIEVQAETQISARIEAAKAAAQAFDPLEMDRFTRLQELTRMMAESVNDVATLQRSLQRTLQSTEDQLAAQARQTRELQEDLLSTRMTEFESLADRLYRVVRQAARDAGRQVRLEIIGGAIEVDRGVLERMAGPFEHLLRNSVAHGIESPDARAAAGKDRSGAITVTVTQAGNEVVVEFADDGAGLNLPRIRERALERGLIGSDATPGDDELAQLIFVPGFSTAGTVTELSGRGVGMDVVRSEIAGMGGRIETHTEAGRGTRFRLVLPLTTAVTQVVMLRCGGMHLAVPSTLVEIVRRVPTAEVVAAYGGGLLAHAGEQVPFYWLAALVEGDAPMEPAGRTQAVVVVRSAAQRVALHVDEVEGNQEVVVKNLGPQLARMPALAGVTLLPSGEVALIYNPVALAALHGEQARARQHRSPAALPVAGERAPARAVHADLAPLVMVVDDSLTVRRITQRLLEREGYRVVLAKDGIEALERLGGERPRVMLCDIEMPRMDGFELVRSLRADPERRGIPVIMITSRIAQKHRDHAAALGVEHYLGKPFAEEALLALVANYCAAAVGA
jgi:chemosensory pili system protein ChpA (sensor histidine kinase/response regulator)